jgi:hypothetical protein
LSVELEIGHGVGVGAETRETAGCETRRIPRVRFIGKLREARVRWQAR